MAEDAWQRTKNGFVSGVVRNGSHWCSEVRNNVRLGLDIEVIHDLELVIIFSLLFKYKFGYKNTNNNKFKLYHPL